MNDEPNPAERPLDTTAHEALTDDFLFHFYQGGELLAAGRLGEALEALTRAGQLKPDNPRCLNLLGLVHFKLGEFARSVDIYRRLVERFPDDATLRINLAMVLLKADQMEEAEQQLNVAIGIQPGNEKAHRTLAVLLIRRGEVDRAREHLRRSGAREQEVGRILSALPAETERAQPELQVIMPTGPHLTAMGTGAVPFHIEDGLLRVQVHDRLFTRLAGLVWMQGDLSFTTVKKRFGGQSTQYPFGSGSQAMVRVDGQGQMEFRLQQTGFRFQQVDPGPAYFLEERVFAFTGAENWENGRLPYLQEENLPVFHLRDPAQIALACRGNLRRQLVDDRGRFLLDVERLVGWSGDLLPRLVRLDRPLPSGLWIELNGTGEVLYLVED